MSTGNNRNIPYSIMKSARVFLDLTQPDLAKAAGVSVSTVISLEAGKPAYESTRAKIIDALERRGIVFADAAPGFTYNEATAIIPLSKTCLLYTSRCV